MDFCSGLQGPSLCCNEYSGTPNRNKSPRTGTNHPGWARCLAVTETVAVSVNLYRATCKLVKFFPCKLKASVLLTRKPFNFQPKLILISLHLHFFVPALLNVSLVYVLRTLVFLFPLLRCFVALSQINFLWICITRFMHSVPSKILVVRYCSIFISLPALKVQLLFLNHYILFLLNNLSLVTFTSCLWVGYTQFFSFSSASN